MSQEIDQLEGSELDWAVAERLMGWRKVPFDDDRTGWCWLAPHGSTRSSTTDAPGYSRTVEAAWWIVRQMQEDGYEYEVGGKRERTWACFKRGMPDGRTANFGAVINQPNQEAIVICRAALKAAGAATCELCEQKTGHLVGERIICTVCEVKIVEDGVYSDGVAVYYDRIPRGLYRR